MSDPVAFRWVEIENFRGFSQRQRLMLDASAVLLVGPNGTGKTSFFDALQWLLLGSLDRLAQLRTKRNAEHIVNQYAGSAPAIVEAELVLEGALVHLRRQGRQDGGLLEWASASEHLSGSAAEERLRRALATRPGQDVRRSLMTSALLQQDVVREALTDKPAERYQQLATLLGLDELSEFDEAARTRAARLTASGKAARAALEHATERLGRVQRDLETLSESRKLRPDVEAARGDAERRLEVARPFVVTRAPETAAEAAVLVQASARLGAQLAKLASDDTALAAEEAREPFDAAALEAGRARLNELAQDLDVARQGLAAAQRRREEYAARSSALAALASQAAPLLGERCPVCDQEIDPDHVRDHLERVMHETSERELGLAVSEVGQAEAQLEAARRLHDIARAEIAPLEEAERRGRVLVERREQWRRDLRDFGSAAGDQATFGALAEIRSGDVGARQQTLAALRVVWRVASELIGALQIDPRERDRAQLEAKLAADKAVVDELKQAASLASAQESEGKWFAEATTRSVTAVTEARFRELAPVVQDIYSRLDPHPSFENFDIDVGIYYKRGIVSPVVVDPVAEVRADPLLVFSSSQANVVALSYFLALGWAAGPDVLPFALLDDPLQSMDDINVLGFADLTRHVRQQRQLVISTHDRRLGALLERKLTPRSADSSTRVLEFQGWTREGPQIEQRVVDRDDARAIRGRVVAPEVA